MTQFQRPNFQRNRQKAYAEERQPTSRTINEIQLPKCPSFGIIEKYRCCRPNVRSGLIFDSVESCSSPSFDNKKTMIVSILCFVFIGGVIGISIYSAHQFYQGTSFPRTLPKCGLHERKYPVNQQLVRPKTWKRISLKVTGQLKYVIQLLVAFQMLSLITRDDTIFFARSTFFNLFHKQNNNFEDPLRTVLSLWTVV